jgi:Tol biopolymer transport system component
MLGLILPFRAEATSATPDPEVPVCSISQITHEDRPGRPFISGQGTRIVFLDAERGLLLSDTTTGATRQLTTREGFDAPPTAFQTIDDAGTHVAYASAANPTGRNTDHNIELFVIEPDSGRITQVTETTSSFNYAPAISGDATRLAFLSTANLTGSNPDRLSEVVLFDAGTGTFAHVGFGGAPAISRGGNRIAFLSDDDLTGQNPERNPELFLFDITSGILVQLTHTTSGGLTSDIPSMNHDGSRIAFQSTANLTGENPDGEARLFLFDANTHMFTQITQGSTGQFSSMDAAGTLIAFRALSPTGNIEVYLADTMHEAITQLTTSGFQRLSVWPSMDAAGKRIAFFSSGDLTGENEEGNSEVFLATCSVVNAKVSLTALESTFKTSADTTGCPAGMTGTFSFTGSLSALASSRPLSNLQLQVQMLTNDNFLQNADLGPARIGATLTVPTTGAYSDGVLSPGETVDVSFAICLRDRSPFRFIVDVLGKAR